MLTEEQIAETLDRNLCEERGEIPRAECELCQGILALAKAARARLDLRRKLADWANGDVAVSLPDDARIHLQRLLAEDEQC